MAANSRREVCAQCTQFCELFHRRGKKSSSSKSFFKVMFGDEFSTILYLPPKFCRTVSDLVDEKIILIDSSGQQWDSRISTVGGSLALEEGWNKFSLDHGLELGDLLIFNLVNRSHFDVIIYDRSGCPANDFSKRKNKRKRCRNRSGSVSSDRDAVFVRQRPNATTVSEMDSQSREVDVVGTQTNVENITKYGKSNEGAHVTCVEENCEEPCHMIGQDDHGVNGTGKITTRESKASRVDNGSHAPQNDATPCNILPSSEGILSSGGGTSNAAKVKLSRRDTNRSACNKISTSKREESRKSDFTKFNGEVHVCQFATNGNGYNRTSTLKHEENRKNNYAKGVESDQVVRSKKKHEWDVDRHLNTKKISTDATNISDDIHNGETSKMTEQESAPPRQSGTTRKSRKRVSLKEKLCAAGDMSKRIKKESHVGMPTNVPSSNYELKETGSVKLIKKELVEGSGMIDQEHDDDDDEEEDIQTSAAVTCVVPTDSDNFLELPTGLPLPSCRGRSKVERMMVYLRNPKDPNRNLSPVLYHDQPLFKILATGWSHFRRANNIRPADVCNFGLEAKSKRIFTVDIVHNS